MIANEQVRVDALRTLTEKRDNVEGAALFAVLPKRRDRRLLELLATYQILWDFLDSASERGAYAGWENGLQLHRALVEALDPETPISDYYRHHPHKDDGAYLLRLVETCRLLCAELPSYHQISELVRVGVERCAIQCINHESDPTLRQVGLREWGEACRGEDGALEWFEWAAAIGAFMPHALLTLATRPTCDSRVVAAVRSTYFPWVSLAITMLDSCVDRTADIAQGDHSYISYYTSRAAMVERVSEVLREATTRAADLRDGQRHAFLIEGIAAMYLSTDRVGESLSPSQVRELARAAGPCALALLSAARLWRTTRTRLCHNPSHRSLPPGPSLPSTLLTYLIWRSPFAYVERCRTRYGKRFTHSMMGYPKLIFLSEPAAIKALLAAPAEVLHPGEGGATIAPIVGARSFMLLDEEEHLNGRRAVLPALQRHVVEQEASWVESAVRQSASEWPRDVPIGLHQRLRALTLEVVLRRIFTGREFGSAARLPALKERTLAMLDVTAGPLLALPALRRGLGAGAWRGFLRDRAATDELLRALIDKRARAIEAGRGLERTDVLTRLLAVGDGEGAGMTREQLRDNAMSLILAGHETTASQLAWAFQLLAHNPRVQRRLIEEIDGGGGEEYLIATIQEVLRHRPVFLFTIPRAVKRPIEIGGFTYEPPAHLLGCIYLLHHDPEVYAEPDEFCPERFLAGQPAPYTWLPWGGGRRRCPGSHLALLEMKTVLRIVLETMTVHPASRRMERPRWRSVIVTPHAGSRVVLRARTGRTLACTDARTSAVRACPARFDRDHIVQRAK